MARVRTWALVTNGVHARIVRGLEKEGPEAPGELISKARSNHLREILADKSGRSFASVGNGRRSAMESRSDPIRLDMQDFARETLEVLEQRHRQGDFNRLAILAAPKMLGILRQELSDTLRATVFLERPINLIHLSEAELRKTILRIVKAVPQVN